MNQRPRPGVTNRANVPPQTPPSRPEDTSITSGRAEDAGLDDMVMEGVYIISVAARILDMHPQTLRKYERLGLINPGRTLGMLRLYSREDIRKLRLIRRLSDEMGLNLAGVEFALATVENLLTLQKRLAVRLNDPAAQQAVEEELEMLLQSLNIPVDL
jgi:MerR family transcriptional regulator/heat shock protein HspR